MFTIDKSHKLDDVCYDIRGPVHKRSPPSSKTKVTASSSSTSAIRPPFGFSAGGIIKDVILNMPQSQGYCDSKGLFSARKAVMQYYQQKGCARSTSTTSTSAMAPASSS